MQQIWMLPNQKPDPCTCLSIQESARLHFSSIYGKFFISKTVGTTTECNFEHCPKTYTSALTTFRNFWRLGFSTPSILLNCSTFLNLKLHVDDRNANVSALTVYPDAVAKVLAMKARFTQDKEVEYQILVRRERDRKERARLRMAKKRAQQRGLPTEEFEAAMERERLYQAEYRERNREKLRTLEMERRVSAYRAAYGEEALNEWLRKRHISRRKKQAKARGKEPYHSGDDLDSEIEDTEGYILGADEGGDSSREPSSSPAPAPAP
ncbi:hypothetical protein R3P38DRAFT_2767088 [Favolaschia claudopus]|uniref:Uncharacterized protein n=1 Tax=Favolaschia claudopus TaxID=2862362 RepID=A0AAW0CXI1_9AGAR